MFWETLEVFDAGVLNILCVAVIAASNTWGITFLTSVPNEPTFAIRGSTSFLERAIMFSLFKT